MVGQKGADANRGPSRDDSWRRLRAFTVVHPVPGTINALVVAALALVAGASGVVAVVLAVAMFAFQCSIGATNDIVDAGEDRVAKLGKPIPGGLVPVRTATVVAVAGAVIGLGISAVFGLAVLVLGAAGYASGMAYDIVLRRHALGWLAFAIAFPLLIAWSWVAASGDLPPAWPLVLPLAALAGPTIHLANSLADVDADTRSGRASLATRLGPARAGRILAVLTASIYGLAWLTLLLLAPVEAIALGLAVVATLMALAGVALSSRPSPRQRETGWLLQAIGIGAIAVAWLAAATT